METQKKPQWNPKQRPTGNPAKKSTCMINPACTEIGRETPHRNLHKPSEYRNPNQDPAWKPRRNRNETQNRDLHTWKPCVEIYMRDKPSICTEIGQETTRRNLHKPSAYIETRIKTLRGNPAWKPCAHVRQKWLAVYLFCHHLLGHKFTKLSTQRGGSF